MSSGVSSPVGFGASAAGDAASAAPHASQNCSPRRDLRRARGTGQGADGVLLGGLGHRTVQRRTALALSTRPTRSCAAAGVHRQVAVRRLQPVSQRGLGRRPAVDADRRVDAVLLDDRERRRQDVHPEAGPVDRVDGEVVDALEGRGQRAQPAARLGLQARPAPPGRGECAARGRHQVERADRALDVTLAGPDPGETERGRGDVARVGARTRDVERLGHVVLAAGLAGERERQLGCELSGHLAVDRVERALRVGRLALGQGDQPGHPRRAPLPRVVHEQCLRGAVGRGVVAGLQRRRATARAAPRR